MWKLLSANAISQFAKHVVPAVLRPARILWNEVVGFLFLVFAVIFGSQAVKYARADDTPRLLLCVVPTSLMLYFGVSSFRRARRISRS